MSTYIENLAKDIARLKRMHPQRAEEIDDILKAAIGTSTTQPGTSKAENHKK